MALDCQDSIQRTLFSKFNLHNYQNCVHDRRWHHEASLAPKINFVSSGINREETASPLRGRRGRKAAPVSPPLHPHGERPGLLQSQRIRVCAPDRERARERGFTWTRLAPIRSEGGVFPCGWRVAPTSAAGGLRKEVEGRCSCRPWHQQRKSTFPCSPVDICEGYRGSLWLGRPMRQISCQRLDSNAMLSRSLVAGAASIGF